MSGTATSLSYILLKIVLFSCKIEHQSTEELLWYILLIKSGKKVNFTFLTVLTGFNDASFYGICWNFYWKMHHKKNGPDFVSIILDAKIKWTSDGLCSSILWTQNIREYLLFLQITYLFTFSLRQNVWCDCLKTMYFALSLVLASYSHGKLIIFIFWSSTLLFLLDLGWYFSWPLLFMFMFMFLV